MSFIFRYRDGVLNLRKYMRECRLPPLLYENFDSFLPLYGHASHKNQLSIRPETYRRLESIYCINENILEPLESWLDAKIPSGSIRAKEPDPLTGESLTIPTPIPNNYQWNLEKCPEDIVRFVQWLDRLPLITVQRILHLSIPETRDWAFRAVPPSSEPDSNIWSQYIWSPRKTQRNQLGTFSQANEPERILVAAQPPWILTESDLEEFITCSSFPPFLLPGHAFPEAHDAAHKLWAKLWDTCIREQTRYFVLTSYTHWVFGVFSPGWTIAFTSAVHKATQTNPTIVELLSFWIISGMGLSGGFVPPKVPEPYYGNPVNVLSPRQAYECADLDDSDSDWDEERSDSMGSSAGVCPTIRTASDGAVPERSRYGRNKKRGFPFIEEWLDQGAIASVDMEEVEAHDLYTFPPSQLPFVVEFELGPSLRDPKNQYIGQWLI